MPETMRGEVRIVTLEDSVKREPFCGLEDCACPDHDFVYPEGVYITVRLDPGHPAIVGAHLGPVELTWPDPKPSDPSTRSEDA